MMTNDEDHLIEGGLKAAALLRDDNFKDLVKAFYTRAADVFYSGPLTRDGDEAALEYRRIVGGLQSFILDLQGQQQAAEQLLSEREAEHERDPLYDDE